MSGGRVILGVGAGVMVEEFEALGVPFRKRGALTNECMAIMQELWTKTDPRYRSERWNLAGFKFASKAFAAALYSALGWWVESRRLAACRHDG